jgi:hypothetical protein
MRKIVLAVACFALIFSAYACRKKEEQPPVPQVQSPMPPGPIIPPGQMPSGEMPPGMMPPGQMQPGMMQKAQAMVVLPDNVKGKWSAAKIIIEDKSSKTRQEYSVKLNSDFSVPDSSLKIQVGEFLPDFRMDGANLTSGSNEPKNPALGIKVFDNDKQIFPAPGKQWGWLFAKVPSIHAFEHPKYGIVLKEGVKKG